MSETNKIVAAQLTNALLVANSNLSGRYTAIPVNLESVADTYRKFLDYLDESEPSK